MNLEKALNDLVRTGKLKKQTGETAYINGLLESAHRNFEAALLIKDKVDEAAFKLAYDGLLQIGRAILLINGYRPDDGEQHKTTFEAAGILLGDNYGELIRKIQRYRIKRNNCIYDPLDLLSKTETEGLIKTAKEFWVKAKKYIKEKNPQLGLFDF